MNDLTPSEQMSLFRSDKALPLLLFSLRPEWHDRFAEGSKAFEYRRRFLRQPFCAAVYISGSTRAIAAFAEFGDPVVGRPDEIIQLAGAADRGVSLSALKGYFGESDRALALPVVSYQTMPHLTLSSIRLVLPNFQPPQSYAYLDRNRPLFDFVSSQPQWEAVLEPWEH